MNRNEACIALALLSGSALGCTEDVGPCDDPREGRDTVLVGTGQVGGSVQYGGQAIINEACAGCHGSQVKGEARRGAPVGLDFDLVPIDSEDLVESSVPMLKVDEAALTGLRERQRRVFEQRNLIWAQVKDGMMPPDGIGAAYRALGRVFDSKEDAICVRAKRSYEGVFAKSSMDTLRNWLACDAPVVEATGARLGEALGKDNMEGVAGKAGYQYPACAPAEPSDDIPFDTVFDSALSTCVMCHDTGAQKPDLSTAAKAYEELIDKKAGGCSGKTYVVPGDPGGSYLLEKVSSMKPECGSRMNQGNGAPLSGVQIQQIRAWIENGAKREPDVADGDEAMSKPTP